MGQDNDGQAELMQYVPPTTLTRQSFMAHERFSRRQAIGLGCAGLGLLGMRWVRAAPAALADWAVPDLVVINARV
jgi:hypothetical protein